MREVFFSHVTEQCLCLIWLRNAAVLGDRGYYVGLMSLLGVLKLHAVLACQTAHYQHV